MNVADIYVRLSIDHEGTTSLERQEQDCRQWCIGNDVAVRQVHVDRGVSGYAPRSARLGFDAVCAAFGSRAVDTVVVWKLDRLSRRGIGQVGQLLDQIEARGGRLVSVMDNLDTHNAQSRMVVALLAELARAESENTSLRVRSAKEGQRAAGRWVGGSPPYGYAITDDRQLVPVDPMAGIMRTIIDSVMDGASLIAICRDLNARGIPNGRGRPWRTSALSDALANPSLAGLMPARHVTGEGFRAPGPPAVYRDRDTGEEVSCLAAGATPIITRERQHALREILRDRRQRYGRGEGAPARQPALRSRGLARCAGCGRTLVTFGHAYRCRRHGEVPDNDCPAPANVQLTRLDSEVFTAWLAYITDSRCPASTRARLVELLVPKQDGKSYRRLAEDAHALSTLRARLVDADEARYVAGQLSEDRYEHIVCELQRRIDRVLCRLASPARTLQVGEMLAPSTLPERWSAAPIALRRQLLAVALREVRVRRAEHPGGKFDATRIAYMWIDSPTGPADASTA